MKKVELKKNEKWTLAETVRLDELIIHDGASVAVPQGKTVTLTVDGDEKEWKAGNWTGDVVLTVCDGYGRKGGIGPSTNFVSSFRGAIYVDETGVVENKSVPAALQGGSYDSEKLEGAKIVSEGPLFGGISVAGGKYSVKDVDITMSGYGGNDFTGNGAGFAASGDADVVVENMTIRSDGVIRIASIVTDKAKVHFKNCDMLCVGGTDEERIATEKATEGLGSMCKVPWMLGLTGNCRTTSILTKGTAIYEDCRISSKSWGALSTDGTSSPKSLDQYSVNMTAKNCVVENLDDRGYGAFSIGACKEDFDNCDFNVGTYALIQANETARASFNNCRINSKHFGTMTYCNQGGPIEVKNSVFNTEMATFLVKSGYPEIICENSQLNSKNGIILQLMDCDDPMYGQYGEIFDAPYREKVEGHDLTKANFHDITIFGIESRNHCTDLRASFKDMDIKGDFYNSITNSCKISGGFNMPDPDDMPDGILPDGFAGTGGPPADMPDFGGGMPDFNAMGSPDPTSAGFSMGNMPAASDYPINLVLSFENTAVQGVISASVAKHSYPKSSEEHWNQMGVVTNTAAPALNNGVIVTLDSGSSWTVTGDSYITALNIASGATVNAGSMTINGVDTPILPGSYAGDILLTK